MKQAIKELLDICDMETCDKKVGWRKRRDSMEQWISKHLVPMETELNIISPKFFDSEFMDFIKESLIKNMSDELTTYTEYDIMDNKIKAKLLVLKE